MCERFWDFLLILRSSRRSMTNGMLTIPLVAALFTEGSCALLAQSTPPSAAPSISSTPNLRTEVRLVIVDVTVLDDKGVSVRELKADDFQLREDNSPQKITSVEEHSSAATTPAVQAPITTADGTTMASNNPLNGLTVWNVLLVDEFNTPKEDQARALKHLQKFVKQLPPNEPLALVAMSRQIKVVIPFQEGAGAVSRFLDKNGMALINSAPPANIYERGEEQEIQTHVGDEPNPEILSNKARIDGERQAQRAQTTLDCFSAIAKWLNGYPGRKNVYWLTAGFPLQGQPFGVLGYDQMHPLGPLGTVPSQTIPMQEKTDKELESARVAIYPIDASGVAAPDIAGETSADTTGDFLAIGKLGDKSIDVKKDDQLKAAEQTEMTAIANATGGVANFNNDIAQALRVDFNQGQNYYTLSYTPSDANWNGAYRRISVNLKQQGYHLFYRRGYFSKSPPLEPSSTVDQFKMALKQGVPAVSGVLFSAKVTTSPDSVEVEYAIDQKTVQYQADPSGKLVANVDCAVLEYDTDGKVIGTSLIRITSKVDPEGRAQLETAPLIAKQSIPLKPGATSLTLGVRDQSNGRFGNREVSLASLQNRTIGITATQHASQPISSSASQPVNESPAAPKGLIHRTPEAAEQMQKAERRITLNVLVTEPSGKPVRGLQQQDFTVLDKARRQAITTFQAVDGFATTPPVELILLLDTMNASFEQVGLARQGMAKFLRQNGGKLPVPVSIVFVSDAAVKLNQASRDGNALAADLEKLQSPMRVNDASKGFEGLLQRFQMSVHTLTQLSTYETTKPGRKMLLWIGPGWPLLSSSAFHTTPQTQRAFFDSIVDLSGRLRKAQITLYSVVPLDLSQGTELRTFMYQSYMGSVENAKQADSGNLSVQVLAYQSGGRALDPSGDLAGQISRCLDDAYIYYKISFDSDPGENGNEYHPLEIKLDRAGLKARTNTGYYAQP